MSLRILFAIHGPRDPKTAVFLTAQRRADYLAARGHAVEIVTPADLPFGSWSRVQPLLLPIGLATRDLRRYDVVVFHSHLAWAHVIAPGRRPGRPAVVVQFHGLEPLYYQALGAELARTGERFTPQFVVFHQTLVPRLLALATRRADRVFCLNSRERDYVVDHGWTDRARVRIVPNGVEASLFLDRPVTAGRATRWLFIGQWLRAKGIRYLVKAFESLAAAHPDVELSCVGTGAGVETVRADFSAAARPRVRVLPRVTREELSGELARADLFVFPSLSEGFSGALLEAMAAALPVIATPAGGVPDLLRDGENGQVVPFADSGALVASINGLMDRADLRRRLGLAAQATARQYEWDPVNAHFADELESAAGSV